MKKSLPQLYVFGWPGYVGGADTKMVHLLDLIHRHFKITLIPNDAFRLQEKQWTQFLDKRGIRYLLREDLPRRLQGIGFGMCNPRFFKEGIAQRVKELGLKLIWSSEMMWHHEGEEEALKNGLIDKVLYVSELQKRYLKPKYGDLPSAMTGNFINPHFFPFRERRNKTFTIGRLSRPAPEKFPEDFPAFYESLELPDTRFRIMAWSKELAQKYRWHRFDERWDLLQAEEEAQVPFLHSLDLFVYPLGHSFLESWGRSTVEAMLTGCIPLVPPGHHLDHLVEHGKSGFICRDFLEYQEHAQRLCLDYPYRAKLSRQCRDHACHKLCNPKEHLQIWKEALT